MGGVVAGNVGNDQADHPRRRGGMGKPAALDARDVLAHHVHRRDRRAGGEQRAVDGDLVVEREVCLPAPAAATSRRRRSARRRDRQPSARRRPPAAAPMRQDPPHPAPGARPAAPRCCGRSPPARAGRRPAPSRGPSHRLSSAAAIWLAALPAPMTTVRPFGFSGRCARIAASGSAAFTASSNSDGQEGAGIVDHARSVLDFEVIDQDAVARRRSRRRRSWRRSSGARGRRDRRRGPPHRRNRR